WDVEASGLDDSNGGTGLTTDEMAGESAPNNMEGFDFEDSWETVVEDDEDSAEDGYPILQDLDREDQLRAQGIYHEKEDDDDGIPGFTMLLLALATIITMAVYWKKR
ncbi:MAG: hypothetical protein ACQEQM_06925, partial [Thermoplasmatota archaeon]